MSKMSIGPVLPRYIKIFAILMVVILTDACATRTAAPVSDRNVDAKRPPATPQTNAPQVAPMQPNNSNAPTGFHDVQKGETLFSIAFQHGLDYREVAQWNGIDDVNVLNTGQRLRLTPPDGAPVVTPVASDSGIVVTPLTSDPSVKPTVNAPTPASPSSALKTEPKAIKLPYSDKALAEIQHTSKAKPEIKQEVKMEPKPDVKVQSTPVASETKVPETKQSSGGGEEEVNWSWPTKGKPKSLFTESTKGIDIPGVKGQPVVAAAAGKVIHVGSNLRGYGKLVIIQHSPMFLSAYAHNNQIIVKEGERVAKGQKIAEMGDSDTDQVKLHFEIRRFGKPVDPSKYLPDEKAS